MVKMLSREDHNTIFVMRIDLIQELGYFFFLLTVLVGVKIFIPVIINSTPYGLNREEKEYFAEKTQLPLVAIGKIHNL